MNLPAMVADSPGNGSGETYTFQYPAGDEDQPLLAIVESVAWVKGVDARALDPLQHVIDIDTLRDILGRSEDDFARGTDDEAGVTVRFQYEGCLVTVTPNHISVERD